MDAVFKVEYFDRPTTTTTKTNRYSAGWQKGCYHADHMRVEINSHDEYSCMYLSDCTTLDAVIAEAEWHLMGAKFGVATIYDDSNGKPYRIAVVTKKYCEDFTNYNYTDYGMKCKNGEAN